MAIAVPRQDREINGHLYRVDKGNNWYIKTETFGWVDERTLHFEQRPWRPFVESPPVNPKTGKPGQLEPGVTFWVNAHYLVHKREVRDDEGIVRQVHLSLRTVENDTRHDWRDLQKIKNELCGPEWEAVEMYPAESRVVDTANQYHLWCFPVILPIGFPVGLRMDQLDVPDGAQQRNGAGQMPVPPPDELMQAAREAGANI